MTEKEMQKIGVNLRAFEYNFGECRIEKCKHRNGYEVFYPKDSLDTIQYCSSIDYLNGWLYGCVQGVLIVAPRKEKVGMAVEADKYK